MSFTDSRFGSIVFFYVFVKERGADVNDNITLNFNYIIPADLRYDKRLKVMKNCFL